MSDYKKVAVGQAAIQTWKHGFEKALAEWRSAPDDKKQATASNLLAFVGSTGATLQSFVDAEGVGISAADAERIRADFKA